MERLNRTLTVSVRAMLFHANMPQSFWTDAMMTAAFVFNFLPSDAIDDRIPWELWHGKQLSAETLLNYIFSDLSFMPIYLVNVVGLKERF